MRDNCKKCHGLCETAASAMPPYRRILVGAHLRCARRLFGGCVRRFGRLGVCPVSLAGLLAVGGVFGLAPAAPAATSPAVAVRAVAEGRNLDWGQLRGTSVPLNWAWPSGAKSATLKIVANGRKTVLKETLSDVSVSSYAWTAPEPSEDVVYDVTLTFDLGDAQSAQLYANPGAFGGVALKGWGADGAATILGGSAIPYSLTWAIGLAGAATFALDGSASALPYSDGYLLAPRVRGSYSATLDFAVEPASPAFQVACDVTGLGLFWLIR